MLATVNALIPFSEWLLQELNARGMSQATLARLADISPASISDILSGRRNVGKDLAAAIASALKIPIEQVFRAAGILPPEPEEDMWVEEMSHKLRLLSPALRSVADRLIDGLVEEQEANQKAKPKTKSARA